MYISYTHTFLHTHEYKNQNQYCRNNIGYCCISFILCLALHCKKLYWSSSLSDYENRKFKFFDWPTSNAFHSKITTGKGLFDIKIFFWERVCIDFVTLVCYAFNVTFSLSGSVLSINIQNGLLMAVEEEQPWSERQIIWRHVSSRFRKPDWLPELQ